MTTHDEKLSAPAKLKEREDRRHDRFVTLVTEGLPQKDPVSGQRVRMDILNRVNALQDKGYQHALKTARAYLETSCIPSHKEATQVIDAMEFYVKEFHRVSNRTPSHADTFRMHTSYLERDLEAPLQQARKDIAASLADEAPDVARALLDNTQMITLYEAVKKGEQTISPCCHKALSACIALEHIRSTIEDNWPRLKEDRRYDTRGR